MTIQQTWDSEIFFCFFKKTKRQLQVNRHQNETFSATLNTSWPNSLNELASWSLAANADTPILVNTQLHLHGSTWEVQTKWNTIPCSLLSSEGGGSRLLCKSKKEIQSETMSNSTTTFHLIGSQDWKRESLTKTRLGAAEVDAMAAATWS